ncbi:hypothetical protein N9S98_01625 [Alphaproteobacteria bacterium]|nr:hypothetical protein [Alphaproteobacteria bacterium]|tara:strand:+ start:287 stop:550 length:264 start_codon:yes stop_codon:yes gene_type:complete
MGMFDRKNTNPEIVRNLKNKITDKLKLPESTMLSIAELNCHEPNCPPKETVITTRAMNGSVESWRIAKSITDINLEDLEILDESKDL